MAQTEAPVADAGVLLEKAHGLQCRVLETVAFLRRCLDQGLSLGEMELDGLGNILGAVFRQIDEAAGDTDAARIMLEKEAGGFQKLVRRAG